MDAARQIIVIDDQRNHHRYLQERLNELGLTADYYYHPDDLPEFRDMEPSDLVLVCDSKDETGRPEMTGALLRRMADPKQEEAIKQLKPRLAFRSSSIMPQCSSGKLAHNFWTDETITPFPILSHEDRQRLKEIRNSTGAGVKFYNQLVADKFRDKVALLCKAGRGSDSFWIGRKKQSRIERLLRRKPEEVVVDRVRTDFKEADRNILRVLCCPS